MFQEKFISLQKVLAMKKSLLILIIIAIVVVAAKLARQKLSSMVNQKLSSIDGIQEMIQDQGVDIRELIQVAMDQMEVKDYFVCNVGRVTFDGTTYPLTVGVFGKVFMLSDYQKEFQNAGRKVDEYKKKLQ